MDLLRQCPGSGPHDAKIILVGEAPGDSELRERKPFVGPAGRLLRKKLLAAGITPESVRFENVCERKISDASELFTGGKKNEIPTDEMRMWIADLKSRIASLRPSVIIAAGGTALFALTGESSITNLHSTVVSRPDLPCPLVPVFHPSHVLRSEHESKRGKDTATFREASPWLVFGLSKAREISETGLRLPERTYVLSPTLETASAFVFGALADPSRLLSIDLELFGAELTCFALAESGVSAISIPFSIAGGSYWNPEDEKRVWQMLAAICGSPNPKIFQNFIFDTLWLSRYGVETKGEIDDTMLMGAIAHPELGKGLDDLARLYTHAPAWKGKRDWSASVDPENLWHYNATDAAITHEIHGALIQELRDAGLLDLYRNHTQPLIKPVYEMCARGWRFDATGLAALDTEMKARLAIIETRIREIAGEKFNPRSPLQVKEYLKSVGITIPTKDGKETTDRRHLLKLRKKHPQNAAIPALLDYSKAAKLRSTYTSVKLDPDGRLRFSVNIGGTKNGRFSSSQTPWNTGLNSQNIPSRDPDSPFSIRHLVVADPGNILVSLDLKQADARIVAWLSRDEAMQKIFASGGDIHSQVASIIFGADIRSLPEAERRMKRYLGKKTVHAANYGEGAETFVDSALEEADLVLPIDEGRRILDSYFAGFPGIRIWQGETRETLRRCRTLINPYGFKRSFHGAFDDALFRDAYAFLPSSTVAYSTNDGWMRLRRRAEERGAYSLHVMQQGHDSIVAEIPESALDLVIADMRSSFDAVTFKIHGVNRNIPYDISFGKNWRALKGAPA